MRLRVQQQITLLAGETMKQQENYIKQNNGRFNACFADFSTQKDGTQRMLHGLLSTDSDDIIRVQIFFLF